KIAKVLGREPYLSRAFAVSADGYSNAARVHQVITEFPRLFVECAAMLGMVSVGAILLAQGRPVSSIAAPMALLAVALVRLIPSFNRITVAATSIRYGVEALNEVYRVLVYVEAPTPMPVEETPMPF